MMRFLASAFLILALTVPATAQKKSQDPRPLTGLDRSSIPRYASVQAFLQAHPAADLRAQATPVGTGGLTMRPLATGLQPTTAGQKGTVAPFSTLKLVRAANGTIRWMEGHLGQTDIRSAGKAAPGQVADAALASASAYAEVLRLDDPASELQPMEVASDDLGYTHARFQQTYAGLPVWGRDLYIHFDPTGLVYAINGTYEPTPSATIVTTPSLTSDQVLRTVEADLRAQDRWAPLPEEVARWLGMEEPATQLVLYPDPDRNDQIRLAYEVTLHPNLLEWYAYLVDARDGQILNRIARHCAVWPEAPLHEVPVVTGWPQPAAASKGSSVGTFFDATVPDLNGQNQNIRVYQHDDNFFYKLWDLPNLNLGQSTLPSEPAGGALTISANSTDFNENVNLTHVTSTNNTWTDAVGVSAHVNMNIAYLYYNTTHQRNAIDGLDQSIISVIHVTDGGQPMENAFWNGRVMAYGDGGQVFKPLAGSLDVAGHEMTHGVIQHTADLIYQFQSGALNESFADVFGVLIEPNDFLLGEDIMQPGQGTALRDLLNPDNPQVLSRQPAHMSQFQNLDANQDNGGVHINSGIPNRAAAIILQNLGTGTTEQIYYRALSNYLTRNSQFGDARNALVRSATDLFGAGSNEVATVEQAFDGVGIFDTSGSGGDEGNDVPPQNGGASLITFMTEDGSIGVLDVTDFNNVQTGFFNDPGAKVRIDVASADRAQLTTSKDGERIWFINQQNQLAFVELQTGQVSVFDNLFLQEPGDLWNASISPDENFVALVSAYVDDPTLYITDGIEIGAIELLPETTQNGVEDENIQYPDVVSWSPNPQVPRIAFDAFNEVPFGTAGGTISYWSMYEIDFTTERIYNLIPGQPTNITVGNVTYSNTNPDLIAFNVLDAQGTWDVIVGNFETGGFTALELSSYTLNNIPITDGLRPTFAPDDSFVSFTSPNLGIMLFSDGTNAPSFLDFGEPIHNPRWFVRGGSGGSQNQAPTAQFSISGSSGTAPFLVGVDASASSDPEGDGLTFRWTFGDGSVGGSVTTAHTYAATGTFTLTLTVTDSGGLSSSISTQVQVNDSGVAVEDETDLPTQFTLAPNYPNPFNPTTTIAYDLPASADVTLTVFDVQGREVRRFVQGVQPAGRYELRFEARDLSSGTYFYRLEAGLFSQTRSFVVLK